MFSVVDKTTVFKRQIRGQIYKDNIKPVSCDANDEKIEELCSQPYMNDVQSNNFDVKALKSYFDVYQEEEKYDCEIFKRKEPLKRMSSHLLKQKNHVLQFPPFAERGVPEGQEDPQKYSSTFNLSESGKEWCTFKDIVSKLDGENSRISKTQLVHKCLHFIPPKTRRRYILPLPVHRNLYIKNIQSYKSDHTAVNNFIHEELKRNFQNNDKPLQSLNTTLVKLITSHDNSKIYKVYKVLSMDGNPLLAVITVNSLYFISHSFSKYDFTMLYSCHFKNIIAVVLGPFLQLVIFLNDEKNRFFINTGFCDSVASELISHLEIAIRRWCYLEKETFHFNVAEIKDLKCMNVFYDVLPEILLEEDEIPVAQFSVWLQEKNIETVNFHRESQKEGYLMAKLGVKNSWSPAYLRLKGGTLYIFEINTKVPKFLIPLQSNVYKGCRILSNASRPHIFEIMLNDNSKFNFGAADETEMIEWIRYLQTSAFKVSNNIFDNKTDPLVKNCFLTLSTNQILLHQFPNEIISRASLSDVTSFRRSIWHGSSYCLLELSCSEATEMTGDWILYFVSENSYKHFCSKFAELVKFSSLGDSNFEDDSFSFPECDRICARIRSSWDSFFA